MGENLDVVNLGSGFALNDVKLSSDFTCVSSTAGNVKCFGLNNKGQLGYGDTTNRGTDVGHMGDALAELDLGTGFSVSATALPSGYGGSHSCLISDDLDVKAWGSNDYGQLGNNDETGQSVGDAANEMGDYLASLDLERDPTTMPTTDPTGDPTAAPSDTPAPTTINEPHMSVNEKSTCSVWEDEVKCWGDRHVVDPTYTGVALDPQYWYRPQIDALDLGTSFYPESVFNGESHQCALSSNGTARCWGDNSHGQCGYGNTLYFSDADNYGKDINVGTDVFIDDMGAGADFNCILTTDNEVKCFGRNQYGQLGVGHSDNVGDADVEMGDGLSSVDLGTFNPTQIAVGANHVCALSDAGDVKCWGRNDAGQLGLGDTTNRGSDPSHMGNALPMVDLGTSFGTASEVLVGSQHSCAVSSGGDLKCWGMSCCTFLCRRIILILSSDD